MPKKQRSKRDKDKLMLAQHVLEVRHTPSGSFLDVRGYVADYVRGSGLFPHWKIDTNVVNFRDMPDGVKLDGAFAGYKSAGYLVHNPETHNYFVDKATAFWKTLLKNQHYHVPEATRFGARTLVFLSSTMSFDQLNRLVFERFFTEKAHELIGGRETDLQFIIDLNEGQFHVRVSGGPLHEDEAGKYLSFESDHFKHCGLFLDIDYYKTKNLAHSSIPRLLREAIDLTWVKVEKIASELGL